MALVETAFAADSGIATVSFNRPDVLNALDVPTAQALRQAVEPLAQRGGLRCVVLRGNGRAFMAGGDVARFAEAPEAAAGVLDQLLDAMHPVVITLRAIDAPVLASVHGAVAGAGLSLMAACDLAIAAAGTRFLVAYDRIGASPDCGGSYFLPRLLGVRHAAEFMLLSGTWDAEQALARGLVNFVAQADQLEAETAKLAGELAAGPTAAYGQYKRLVEQAFSRPLAEQLEAEREAFRAATATEDFRTGTAAFVAKTKARPAFRGR